MDSCSVYHLNFMKQVSIVCGWVKSTNFKVIAISNDFGLWKLDTAHCGLWKLKHIMLSSFVVYGENHTQGSTLVESHNGKVFYTQHSYGHLITALMEHCTPSLLWGCGMHYACCNALMIIIKSLAFHQSRACWEYGPLYKQGSRLFAGTECSPEVLYTMVM